MEVSLINTMLGRRAGVLSLVFRLLHRRDMRSVVLVCRLWREVGEAPTYWAGLQLQVMGASLICSFVSYFVT